MKAISNKGRVGYLISGAWLLLLAPAFLRAQATAEGQVVNGTTNRPVSGAKVLLLQPRQGMQEAGTTVTDARGHFVFPAAGVDPQSFYLVQVNFQDVPYHAPVQFSPGGKAEINVTVYDSTRQ